MAFSLFWHVLCVQPSPPPSTLNIDGDPLMRCAVFLQEAIRFQVFNCHYLQQPINTLEMPHFLLRMRTINPSKCTRPLVIHARQFGQEHMHFVCKNLEILSTPFFPCPFVCRPVVDILHRLYYFLAVLEKIMNHFLANIPLGARLFRISPKVESRINTEKTFRISTEINTWD